MSVAKKAWHVSACEIFRLGHTVGKAFFLWFFSNELSGPNGFTSERRTRIINMVIPECIEKARNPQRGNDTSVTPNNDTSALLMSRLLYLFHSLMML